MHPEKVLNVKYIGKQQTYDLEVDNKNHLYYANGIATSNSHGVSYAVSAYYSAYAKCHFPLHFFTSYLLHSDDKQDVFEERRRLVDDAKNFNIEVRPPSLLNTENNIHISGKNTISFGIANIKGTGLSILDKVKGAISQTEIDLKKRLKDWKWVEYLMWFTDKIPLQTNNGLILSGACDFFSQPRQLMLFEYDIWNKLTDREKTYIRSISPENLLSGLQNLVLNFKINIKRKLTAQSFIASLENPPTTLQDTPDWIAWNEEKLLGISLSCHKVDGCEKGIESTHSCRDVHTSSPKYAVVAVQVVRVKEVTTKNGKNPGSKMAFVDLSDGSYTLEGIPVFPDIWKENKSLLQQENTLCVQLNKLPNGGYSINKTWQI